MKTRLLCIASSLLIAAGSYSIPQQFNNGPNFFNAVGVQFEQFAAAGDTWKPGAELKGKWNGRAGEKEVFELGVDAAVFGIPAARVTALRTGGAVQKFRVQFDDSVTADGKARKADLFSQVTANLKAVAGEPKSISPDGAHIFRYDSALVSARREGARQVIVEFTPAR